jgi:hypothetical protein
MPAQDWKPFDGWAGIYAQKFGIIADCPGRPGMVIRFGRE